MDALSPVPGTPVATPGGILADRGLMHYHFSGIAGAGMNPLAQLMRARGHRVQGSDRALDQGKSPELAARLRRCGIELLPHDGSAITSGVDRFVHSTAVEADTAEMRAARALGAKLVPRPALLAEVVNAGQPGVAIAGTSGKSTVTGMLAWVLRESGLPATVLGGAGLVRDGSGGFTAGPADGPVIVEACESDGTLIGYAPTVGVVHNISRDHAEIPSLVEQFTAFGRNCRRLLVNAGCPVAAALGRRLRAPMAYGVAPGVEAPLEILGVGPERAQGLLRLPGGVIRLDLPQPGQHNLENATAAALVALELGIDPGEVERLLALFPGVSRRFEVVGVTRPGIRVVDDYAHNAEKLRAAISTAQAGSARVLAVFQPHGYGPARFLRPDLRALLPALLRPADRFCYAEIFYAGGTVARDISSRSLAGDLPAELGCAYAADHDAARQWAVAEARPGDTILIMGARDPDLPRLARSILDALAGA